MKNWSQHSKKEIITRFAPSPTGFLHIGGARTALFNYLFAKANNGKFLLRIEDTDKARSSKEAIDAIYSGMKWLGIEYDETPFIQSKRGSIHYSYALDLIKSGKAYYCFTPQEEINKAREESYAKKENFIFKSKWRDATASDYPKNIKPVIRLKVENTGQTIIQDLLQGDVIINNEHLDDMVLVRGDATPTYMLSVVADDHDMNITHIIRGDDHLTNAARQIQIYKAFNWKVPHMIHIPLIHGPDGAKLSKRHGALGVDGYQKMGYLPEALCNYLLRLGWSCGDEEIISKERASRIFDLKGLGKSPAKLDFEKMRFLNAHYLRAKDNIELVELVIKEIKNNLQYSVSEEEKSYIVKGMDSMKQRVELLKELALIAEVYLVSKDIVYTQDAIDVIKNCNKEYIKLLSEAIASLADEQLEKDFVQEICKEIAQRFGIKLGELMSPIRCLITGKTISQSVFEIISIIGKENSLSRLRKIAIIC